MSNNQDITNIWKSYQDHLDQKLQINTDKALRIKQEVNGELKQLFLPKIILLIIGSIYILALGACALITFVSQSFISAFSFSGITLLMLAVLIIYFYQLYLIQKIRLDNNLIHTQKRLSKLRISSHNSLYISIFQLPLWVSCWVSMDALKESPLVYGGVNLLIFILMLSFTIYIFKKSQTKNRESAFYRFFNSGKEWDPIHKSISVLKQLNEIDDYAINPTE